MSALLAAVMRGQPVDLAQWRSFWDRLQSDRPVRGEAAAILAAMSTRIPDPATMEAFVSSIVDGPERFTLPDTVNIVGTGGGCPTFNISTAAALVAAAQGIRVVKTGSRAYSSRLGSFDLLTRLGIPLTTSVAQTMDALDRDGVAFAGSFVYPVELTALAKAVAPLDFRVLGRVVNVVGPFLPQVTASAQLTGVADPAHLPVLRRLARRGHDRRIWLCSNDLGADELIGFAGNEIDRGPGQTALRIGPEDLGLNFGVLADLAPAADPTHAVGQFLALLAGDAAPVALQAVCLNAAALAVLSGHTANWSDALGSASEAVMSGRALRLVDRLRGARVVGHV